ncbi:MAG: phosphoglucosamine mutase, partial [Verrucomicrobiota bacterium]
MHESVKIGISGVRGVVGQSFTPQLACSFAQAFGCLVGQGQVVVGRDTRPSGRMIEQAVVAGLQSVGCRPVLAGIIPTPTILYLTRALGARGGIAITASHNEAPWNALKFADRDGMFLDPIQADELFDIYHQRDFAFIRESDIRPVKTEKHATDGHFQKVVNYVDAAAIRERAFKVAVDCCNGVGALHTVNFLEQHFGCSVVPLFDQPTGDFERGPEPAPEHLGALSQIVTAHGCDIGFAQDPDGDRLAIVDEQGVPIGEDMSLAFAIQQVLKAHEQGPVVCNVSVGRKIRDAMKQQNRELILTPTGEIHVSKKLVEIGGVVGGE